MPSEPVDSDRPVRREGDGRTEAPGAEAEARPMRYALLIYVTEPAEDAVDVMPSEFAEYEAFSTYIRTRGAFQAGDALQSTATATTVRVRDGQTLATDGPFAETKEALGGFYLVEATDLDEAIDFASRIPGAKHGSIEIRPIFELPSEVIGASAEAATPN
jgi:hypothetical protein